ncbi:MAG TPA: tetratricopeptide repeat protein [Oligoflexus sp.]|uniref:tetratricopeptide repeat protein n=1 Tax=Oligoflexus sp. TaxID=1971216 RepID=UPI002D7E1AC5|nr:tetratricopeptide repeat protein [Oligoflexus sp.]HET9236676.1 tetratricopeptide repeat protein [Oligoflexus sp.]
MINGKDVRLAVTARGQEDAARIVHVTQSLKFPNVDVFLNTRDTYQAAVRRQYQLFITYQNFADMSGLTMIQSLRETGNYGLEPHMVLVDNLDRLIMVVLAEHNIKYVIPKPFDSSHILQKLQSLFHEELTLSEEEKAFREAHAAMSSGLVDMALDLATKLVKSHKPLEKSLLLLGDIFLKLGRHDDARKVYQKARELFPQSYVPTHKIAKLLMKEKRFDEAVPLLDELARLSPLNLEILANTGLSNFELGRYEEAKAAMKKLKTLDRLRKDANEVLARVAMRAGDFRGSLAALQDSHGSKELFEVLHREVQTMREQKAYVRVIDFYLKFIEMMQDHPYLYDLYYRLGIAYQDIFDEMNAKRYLKKALQMEPDYEPAALALTKMG